MSEHQSHTTQLNTPLNIEQVRFSGEAHFASALQQLSSFASGLPTPDADPQRIRRQLMAHSLLLSKGMAPDLHQAAQECAQLFAIHEPFEIYQAAGAENAAMHLTPSPVLMEIQGKLLSLLDPLAMKAVIGHELGHYLAHGHGNTHSGIDHALSQVIHGAHVSDDVLKLALKYSMARELTADRFGLLACANLDAALRLEMVMVTGLPADSLTWDTQAYLAQSKALMDATLAAASDAPSSAGAGTELSTHPEHSLRTYAIWLFSETDVYQQLTGQGPGTRTLQEVDATLMRILGQPDIELGVAEVLDDTPPELHECALSACVLVAMADGEMHDSELEAIERIFAPLLSEWQALTDETAALARFQTLAPLIQRAGPKTQRSLFSLLIHVLFADGEAHESEIDTVLAIGTALGCRKLFENLLEPLLDQFQIDIQVLLESSRSIPMPPRSADAQAALDIWLEETARRGKGQVTLRRLLRLLGTTQAQEEPLRLIHRLAGKHALLFSPPLGEDLDTLHQLSLTPEAEDRRKQHTAPPPIGIGDDAQRLRNGLTRLRDLLISGDGRSPSIRLRKCRSGRNLDLHLFERVSTGLAERSLAHIQAGKRARLLEATEVGHHDAAQQLARELTNLEREYKSRLDETGARDLCLGYPFITGLVGGYLVRAPLLLYPVNIERSNIKDPNYTLTPLQDSEPFVNQSALRLMFARKNLAYNDELSEHLDEMASASMTDLLGELSRFGLPTIDLSGELTPFADRSEEFDLWRDDRLEVEECAVIGLFPQSSSDLLQDYDELLAAIDAGKLPTDLLGSATAVLPADLKDRYSPSTPETDTSQTPPAPVIYADPSQQAVLTKARQSKALVVDGPPGTGKSQVIVNLVADALSRGQRVAVVCEKRAALDVVANRLASVGMRHLLAVVHDVHEDRKPLYKQIKDRLNEPLNRPDTQAQWQRNQQESQPLLRALDEKSSALHLNHQHFSLGQYHTYSASLDVPHTEFTALADLNQAQIDKLAQPISQLEHFADLWRTNSLWISDDPKQIRPSMGHWDGPKRQSFSEQLQAAQDAAQSYETLLSEQGLQSEQGTDLDQAQLALETALESRPHRTTDQSLSAMASLFSQTELKQEIGTTHQIWRDAKDATRKFDTPVQMTVQPDQQQALGTLTAHGTGFGRLFKPSWWKARGTVKTLLTEQWPEMAQHPITPLLAQGILTRHASAQAWQSLEELTRIDPDLSAPNTAKEVSDWLSHLQQLNQDVQTLSSLQASLEAIDAWPRVMVAAGLREWEQQLDARQALLQQRKRLRESSKTIHQQLPWLSPCPSQSELQDLSKAWWQDGIRLTEADRHLELASTIEPNAHHLLRQFANQTEAPPQTAQPWADRLRKTWAQAVINRLEQQHQQISRLDNEAGDIDQQQGRQLSELVDQQADISARHLLALQDQRPFLTVPKPEKGRRRTPEQATREAMEREAGKQRRLMPLRSFVRRFLDDGLLDVLPIWLLSPETMAVLFPRKPIFDLVILDEGSQCTVESGLPVLMRAQRVVVAGDEKQMPPSNFFKSSGSDNDPDEETNVERQQAKEMFDAESLLVLSRARAEHIGLKWHYRCLHEELIAFSNHALYDGSLNTIPSTASRLAPAAIKWESVSDAEYEAGVNVTEAARVAELLDELLQRPDQPSVGIVTFNLSQRRAILDAIDARRADSSEFAERYDTAMSQTQVDLRPFVKNLEGVQGDERDIIMFSLGHAPKQRQRRDGKQDLYVPARFGPLGRKGGERRLNVAISRAKQEIIIVSSFAPKLLSVANSKHEGPKLLKAFLEFAQHMANAQNNQAERVLSMVRSNPVQSDHHQDDLPESYLPLKAQIALELEKLGIGSELDVGTSEFRLPLAIPDPRSPEHYRLGILCDEGNTPAHPMETHVHIPNVLKMRGWNTLRVNAREWHRDQPGCLRRIQQALDASGSQHP